MKKLRELKTAAKREETSKLIDAELDAERKSKKIIQL
jgi:hypothetical protein